MKKWEKAVLATVRLLDPGALGGKNIRKKGGLPAAVFDSRPEDQASPARTALQRLLAVMTASAHRDGRLPGTKPLVKLWQLAYDVYSPRWRRFVEVDERQHFSKVRVARIAARRRHKGAGIYSDRFWLAVLPGIRKRPARDLDPPHRDEARAYRDEAREILPVQHGLQRTIRLDQYTVADAMRKGDLKNLLSRLLKAP